MRRSFAMNTRILFQSPPFGQARFWLGVVAPKNAILIGLMFALAKGFA